MDFLKKLGEILLKPFSSSSKEPERQSYQSSDLRKVDDEYRQARPRGTGDRHERGRRNSRGGRSRSGGQRKERGPRPEEGRSEGGEKHPGNQRSRGGRRFDRNRRGGHGRRSGRPDAVPREAGIQNSKPPVERKSSPKEELAGVVTHFFDQVHAAAVMLEAPLSVGDMVAFKGPETAFRMKVESIQINRAPVTNAEKGTEIGIEVKGKVKVGDKVYRVL